MSPTERKELLRKARRCYLCFKPGHNVARCNVKYSCIKCKRKHHTLLHAAEDKISTFYTVEDEEADTEAATEVLDYSMVTCAPLTGAGRVSLRTLPVFVENPANGKKIKINAMLDDGCSAALLLSRRVAELLALRGKPTSARTEGVGGQVLTYDTIIVPLRRSGERRGGEGGCGTL